MHTKNAMVCQGLDLTIRERLLLILAKHSMGRVKIKKRLHGYCCDSMIYLFRLNKKYQHNNDQLHKGIGYNTVHVDFDSFHFVLCSLAVRKK